MDSSFLSEYKARRKKFYGKVFAMSFSTCVVAMLVTIIAFFLPFSIIITYPLIMIPFIFCAITGTLRLDREPDLDFKTYYMNFPVGYAPNMRSCLKTLATFFQAFLIMVVTLTCAFSIVMSLPAIKPLYEDFVNNLPAGSFNQQYELFLKFLQSDKIWPYYAVSTAISYGLGFIYFVSSLFQKLLYTRAKMYCMLPSGKNQPIFREVFQKYAKTYYHGLWKSTWHLYVLLILGYSVGALIAFFTHQLAAMSFLGILFALLFIIPAFPDLLIYNDLFLSKIDRELREKNAERFAKQMIEMRENNPDLSDFKKEIIDELLHDEDFLNGTDHEKYLDEKFGKKAELEDKENNEEKTDDDEDK